MKKGENKCDTCKKKDCPTRERLLKGTEVRYCKDYEEEK